MPRRTELESAEYVRTRRYVMEQRRKAVPLREIAEELGVSIATVKNWHTEAIATYLPPEEREEALTVELDRIDHSERACQDRMELIKARAQLAVDEKRGIKMGQGEVDPIGWMAEQLRKEEELLVQWRKRRAMLKGLDTPVSVHHLHKVRTEFDAEIEGLVTDLLNGGAIMTSPDEVIIDA